MDLEGVGAIYTDNCKAYFYRGSGQCGDTRLELLGTAAGGGDADYATTVRNAGGDLQKAPS